MILQWGIILAKGQLDHSHFLSYAYFDIQPRGKFWAPPSIINFIALSFVFDISIIDIFYTKQQSELTPLIFSRPRFGKRLDMVYFAIQEKK